MQHIFLMHYFSRPYMVSNPTVILLVIFYSTSLASCFCIHIHRRQYIKQITSCNNTHASTRSITGTFFCFPCHVTDYCNHTKVEHICIEELKWGIEAYERLLRLTAKFSYPHHCNEKYCGNRKARKEGDGRVWTLLFIYFFYMCRVVYAFFLYEFDYTGKGQHVGDEKTAGENEEVSIRQCVHM